MRRTPNPVLPGSHPDPSVVRVGGDYYLATSTFEWSPGVRVHHSRDLVTWRPLGGVLDGRHLDLTGCPDSGGVWAPNLSHADGLFHLVYSNVSTYLGGFTDSPNHLVTAPSIDGPWSAPVPLHARGFDASLFHDEDGRSWLLNLVHDWRPGHGGSAGLEAVRYDRSARRLDGTPVPIELPPGGGWIEGPNLYRVGDWYYLLTADGGTGWAHRVTVARSRTLAGPYERDPAGPLVTAYDRPDWPLQKAGHGSLVRTPAGDWFLAYLVARPLGVHGRCLLGRETAIAPVTWTADGWPRIPGALPVLGDEPAAEDETDGFDQPVLGPQWSTLRRPAAPDWLSLTERPSRLRIRGGRSPQSLIGPSLVARRITAYRCAFEATVEFRAEGFQQLAGVTAYYNTRNWHFCYVTDDGGPVLRVATCDRGEVRVHPAGVPLPDGPVRVGFDLDHGDLTFRYDTGDGWRRCGPVLDPLILSDEHATEITGADVRTLAFTGAFAGLWVWDLTGGGHPADFADAAYRTGVQTVSGSPTVSRSV
ncbi:family 43 glycosylhydrolase [Hamadaea tsunoensis]|uniref:family 43 glycosylhydrolase n=1 Tax=Hamadaea tsunoensis TaxID=53368 RepID=UPI0006885BD2|nr:family 43 glycosylhydrolase [Hamadaea tsunoensis]